MLVGGAVVGLGVAGALWRWRRRQRAAAGAGEADAAEVARQLPLAADLLAACVAAGAGPVIAAQAVGEALAGPVGEGLARGAAEVRLGGERADAWRRLAALPGARPLARLLERADESGLPAAGPVARPATDARAQWTRTRAREQSPMTMTTAEAGTSAAPASLPGCSVPGRPSGRSARTVPGRPPRSGRTARMGGGRSGQPTPCRRAVTGSDVLIQAVPLTRSALT
ncbi:hypothetical protein [Streptomyces sp. NPDC102462]|uniref:hypothetical protein n=1 Tax=Streptomyces sp. NPDC102462 TaxID=3366178 RepID=UPI00381F1ACC